MHILQIKNNVCSKDKHEVIFFYMMEYKNGENRLFDEFVCSIIDCLLFSFQINK